MVKYAWTGQSFHGLVLTKEEMKQTMDACRKTHPDAIEAISDFDKGSDTSFTITGENGTFIQIKALNGDITEGAVLNPSKYGAVDKLFPNRDTLYIILSDKNPWNGFDESGQAYPSYSSWEELYSEMRLKAEYICCTLTDIENRIGMLQCAQSKLIDTENPNAPS